MKRASAPVALGLSIVLAMLFMSKVYPQQIYWTGLNFELVFGRSGAVLVVLDQHPFDQQGRSLIGNRSVDEEVIALENSTVEMGVLLFSATTGGVNYNVVSHSQVDLSKSVFCNLGFSEGMKTFRGAITTTFKIMLNTTTSLTRISDDTYQVVVADFYTASDPQSWIDAIDFRFTDGVALLNYSFSPSWAKAPTTTSADHLSWVNENEADAPDYYVFTLTIPDVIFSTALVKLEGKISQAQVISGQSTLSVKVRNTGQSQGTFIVQVIEGKYDQARKVSLSANEETSVQFPLHIAEGTVQVSLLADGSTLDRSELQIGVGQASTIPEIIRFLAYALLMVGLASLVLYLMDRTAHAHV